MKDIVIYEYGLSELRSEPKTTGGDLRGQNLMGWVVFLFYQCRLTKRKVEWRNPLDLYSQLIPTIHDNMITRYYGLSRLLFFFLEVSLFGCV